jgi:hypothetical protein
VLLMSNGADVNGDPVIVNQLGSTTESGGSWTVTLDGGLSIGDFGCGYNLTAVAYIGSECLSSPATEVAVPAGTTSATPTINGSYCGTVNSVSGTSSEDEGSIVSVYANAALQGSTTVDANGDWSLSGLSLTSANSPITATVQNNSGCETVSTAASVTISSPSSVGSLAITSPISENASTIQVTSATAGNTINLYIDGFLLATNTADGSGQYTFNLSTDVVDPTDLVSYGIYAGGSISATQNS